MQPFSNNTEHPSNLLIGRNPVQEALRAGREIDRLLVSREAAAGRLGAILSAARARGILIKEVSPVKLDAICGGAVHQGIVAVAADYAYQTVSSMLERAAQAGTAPLLVICDCIEDPHNLGAIIRTAEAAGAHGVILPERHSAMLNHTVAKAACGALEYVSVARVQNIARLLDELKTAGLWIYGAHMQGQSCYDTDLTGPLALVIGSEGKGLRPLVQAKCDLLISLPMYGQVNSLNASVAAGLLMYETVRQRAGG